MAKTRTKKPAPFLALVILAGSGAACTASGKGPSVVAREMHPDVGASGADTCASCHADATPEVAQAWKESRHGLALVECFVCHGAIDTGGPAVPPLAAGGDFRLRPEPATCAGCHASQVASVTVDGRVRDCFLCHPAHALLPAKGGSPHGTKEGGRP